MIKDFMPVLKSWRFWVVVFIGIVEGLQANGYLDEGSGKMVLEMLEYILGTAGIVRTIDRLGDKKAE